jgi:hypothetical protein
VFIVEELMQSDLSELIHNNDLLPLDDVLRWGRGVRGGWGGASRLGMQQGRAESRAFGSAPSAI